ncbi:MAG: hypothetical protein KC910_01090, partial [Candidatus Eremiobacteraeota bacterium]|nr:hypothetical protein [Candidatus Eremiobacteraeota bacterium]
RGAFQPSWKSRSMEITIDRLVADGGTLSRALTAVSPDFADQVLLASAVARQGRPGQYLVGTGWLQGAVEAGPDGEVVVRFAKELEGIPPYRLEVDPRRRPSMFWLGEFCRLLAGLGQGQSVQVLGDQRGEVQFGIRPEQVEPLQENMAATAACCSPGYNQRVVGEAGARLRDRLLEDDPLAALEQEWRNVKDLREAVAADGFLTAWFALYADLCRHLARDLDRAGLVRFIGFGCAGMICDPAALMVGLADKVHREGHEPVLRGCAQRASARARRRLKQALESTTRARFEHNLYWASVDSLVAAAAQQPLSGRSVSCERALVSALGLIHRLEDRAGERSEAHARQLRGLRPEARQARLKELVDRNCFYSRQLARQL